MNCENFTNAPPTLGTTPTHPPQQQHQQQQQQQHYPSPSVATTHPVPSDISFTLRDCSRLDAVTTTAISSIVAASEVSGFPSPDFPIGDLNITATGSSTILADLDTMEVDDQRAVDDDDIIPALIPALTSTPTPTSIKIEPSIRDNSEHFARPVDPPYSFEPPDAVDPVDTIRSAQPTRYSVYPTSLLPTTTTTPTTITNDTTAEDGPGTANPTTTTTPPNDNASTQSSVADSDADSSLPRRLRVVLRRTGRRHQLLRHRVYQHEKRLDREHELLLQDNLLRFSSCHVINVIGVIGVIR